MTSNDTKSRRFFNCSRVNHRMTVPLGLLVMVYAMMASHRSSAQTTPKPGATTQPSSSAAAVAPKAATTTSQPKAASGSASGPTQKPATQVKGISTGAEEEDPSGGDDVVTSSSTRFDFGETSIDGKMKAPAGFFLQGQNDNSLSQMVKLRSHFRNELRNSRSAVKSHVK